jgi:isocitrate dehydrogenase
LIARADIDGTPEVRKFAETLEDVIIKTVESGKMTKDLAALVGKEQAWQTTEEFLSAVAENLRIRMA